MAGTCLNRAGVSIGPDPEFSTVGNYRLPAPRTDGTRAHRFGGCLHGHERVWTGGKVISEVGPVPAGVNVAKLKSRETSSAKSTTPVAAHRGSPDFPPPEFVLLPFDYPALRRQ